MRKLAIFLVVLFFNISNSLAEEVVYANTHLQNNTQLKKKEVLSASIVNYLTWISNNYPGYVGMWPPTRTVTLGSIGSMGPDGFTQYTTIDLQPQNSDDSQLSMQYRAKIVKNPTPDHALSVSFTGVNGFVVQATDLSSTSAANLTAVKEIAAQKLQDGDWDPSWYVVVGVQIASVATIIVSQGKETELTLDGTVGTPLPLASDAQLSVASTKGNITLFLCTEYPVIMYRAVKVSEAWDLPAIPQVKVVGAHGPIPSVELSARTSC